MKAGNFMTAVLPIRRQYSIMMKNSALKLKVPASSCKKAAVLKSPSQPGFYRHRFFIRQKNTTRITIIKNRIIISVTAKHQGGIISSSVTGAMTKRICAIN
jgi:hypothetical protein